MSTRRHKRRRVDRDLEQLYEPTSPADDTHAEGTEATADPEPAVEAPKEGIDGDSEAFAKEAEIWDSFREEHYEVLEQLPLTLHRVFKLIHELDGQAQERISNLSPAILKYVSLRRALVGADKGAGEQSEVLEGETANDDPPASGDQQAAEFHNINGNSKLSNGSSLSPPPASSAGAPSTKSRTTPVPPKSLAAVVESSDSTREVLISIAQSAEEISRASNEKYYLARYVHELVDRYMRDLDRSIKEQEASITLGLRPGTHPASIILPEVVLPKLNRSRVVTSPPPFEIPMDPLLLPQPAEDPPSEEVQETPPLAEEETPDPPPAPDEQDEPVEIVESEEPAGDAAEPPVRVRGKRKGRKRRKSTRTRSEAPPAEEQAVAEGSVEPEPEEEDAPAEHQPPLMLKIPAQNLALQSLVEPELLDPNEPRYCFCNQVSYGEMIACDNPSCEREWFHMGCVGVTKTPKGKWYCRECIDQVKRPKHRKRPR